MTVLQPDFYNRSPLLVAPDLLGKILVRMIDGHTLSGRIVEVEAYLAFEDEASHAFVGKTRRNASLFTSAGHAYVHTIHTHHCLDIVTENEDIPSGILIRALEPISGIEAMKKFRNKENVRDLTSGPGKLTQALRIDMQFNGLDITDTKSLLYVVDDGFSLKNVARGKRIRISKATEEDFRFYMKENEFVSK